MKASSSWLLLAGAIAVVAVVPLPAFGADRVSGTLTQTYVIVEDTDLVGDITCNVANGAPCFSFGASDVELRLNGFSMTGRGDAITGCGGVSTGGESGVSTNNMNRVAVRGPGLVHRFRGDGVTVIGSTDARVEDLTTSTNCMSGVRIVGTSFGTLVQNVVSVRNGATAPPCGGIWVLGHNSRVRLNAAQGNGYSEPANDFGIGLVGTASGNVIEENSMTGNTNGLYIDPGATNNVVRDNVIVGNPALQSSNTRPTIQAVDILNLAPASATTFERNACVTAVNAPCPASPPRRPPQ